MEILQTLISSPLTISNKWFLCFLPFHIEFCHQVIQKNSVIYHYKTKNEWLSNFWMIMNKQSSKGKNSILPNVTEYLFLQIFFRSVPCIEMANTWQYLYLNIAIAIKKMTDSFGLKLVQFFVKLVCYKKINSLHFNIFRLHHGRKKLYDIYMYIIVAICSFESFDRFCLLGIYTKGSSIYL